jgi:hypothetical protein
VDASRERSQESPLCDGSQVQILWDKLPIEIVLEIFVSSHIREVLSFATCCRSFRSRFGNEAFLSSLLRDQMRRPHGSMYWLLPVATINEEVEKFCQACRESKVLESNGKDQPTLMDAAIIFSQEFPLYNFVQANYRTESMRNRRRLWRISRQFRREWYRYRTKGYHDQNAYKPEFST